MQTTACFMSATTTYRLGGYGTPRGSREETMSKAPVFGATYVPFGAEVDVRDCPVEGRIPANLSGGFYAVGPDPMYPLAPGNIPFDGDGHVRLFRIRNGRVDYRTRYVRTERYIAQD